MPHLVSRRLANKTQDAPTWEHSRTQAVDPEIGMSQESKSNRESLGSFRWWWNTHLVRGAEVKKATPGSSHTSYQVQDLEAGLKGLRTEETEVPRSQCPPLVTNLASKPNGGNSRSKLANTLHDGSLGAPRKRSPPPPPVPPRPTLDSNRQSPNCAPLSTPATTSQRIYKRFDPTLLKPFARDAARPLPHSVSTGTIQHAKPASDGIQDKPLDNGSSSLARRPQSVGAQPFAGVGHQMKVGSISQTGSPSNPIIPSDRGHTTATSRARNNCQATIQSPSRLTPPSPSQYDSPTKNGNSQAAVQCSGYTKQGKPCKRMVKSAAPFALVQATEAVAGLTPSSLQQASLTLQPEPRYCRDHVKQICELDGFYWKGQRRDKWIQFSDWIPIDLEEQSKALLRLTMESELSRMVSFPPMLFLIFRGLDHQAFCHLCLSPTGIGGVHLCIRTPR